MELRDHVRSPNEGKQRGFTLIELSVVIAIAAVILGAVISLVTAQVQSARNTSMSTKLELIKSALIMFVARNNRLPCPAVEIRGPSDADYGVEAAVLGTCTGTTELGIVARRGVLPWVTLGLGSEDALDPYGSRFTYVVTLAETNRTADTVAAMSGVLTLHSDAPPVLGLPGTGNQTNACSTTAGDNSCNNAAVALVISHGPNAHGAFQSNGQQTPFPDDPSARELANANDDTMFVLTTYSENPPTFDDRILTLTPDSVLSGLIRDGSIRSARAITNETLRVLQDSTITIVMDAGGAVPPTTTLQNDIWGRSFQRAQLAANVCTAKPGSDAFSITSRGYDDTGAADDLKVTQSADQIRAYMLKLGMACP